LGGFSSGDGVREALFLSSSAAPYNCPSSLVSILHTDVTETDTFYLPNISSKLSTGFTQYKGLQALLVCEHSTNTIPFDKWGEQ